MSQSYREDCNDAKAVRRGVKEQKERRGKSKKKDEPQWFVYWLWDWAMSGSKPWPFAKCRRLEEAIAQCDKLRRSHTGKFWIEGPDVPPEYQRPAS